MKNFYTLNIEKDGEVDVNDLTRVEIIVASDGSYYFDDSLVVFSEPSALPDSLKLDLDRGDKVEVVIHMRSGASEESLSGVFNYFAAQGVGSVKLLSEE